MSVPRAGLTVYFDPPLGGGLYQREGEDSVGVGRVGFGGEPRDQQVLDWFQAHFRELEFSPPAAGGRSPDRAVNPKRARREAAKAVWPARIGTKAQQALKLQQEQMKRSRKIISKEQREAERERKLVLRQEKRREKHKGH